jgi:hypothetical protein
VVVAFGVAIGAPLETAVLGLLLIGVAHLVLEVRYVLGHYRSMLHGRLLVATNLALVVVVAGRLLWPGTLSRTTEIVVATALIAAAVVRRWGRRTAALAAGLAVVIGLGAWGLTHPEGWFVAQAHLHNLVPAVFVWVWAAEIADERARRACRAVVVGWVLVVPVILVSGFADPLLADPSAGPAAEVARQGGVLAGLSPSDVSSTVTARLLALFAFAQVVHYGVWCWFFPRHGGPADAEWDRSRAARWSRPSMTAAVVVAGTALVVGLAWLDYRRGRTFYASLGAYHAYLELPVLVALLSGLRPAPRTALETS